MTKTTPTAPVRKPWLRPAVQKIAAGQAEVGNGSRSDNPFASS